MRLNLGCGNKRRDGFVGVDLYPCEAAEVRADITGALPFKDDSIQAVHLDNVIEHIPDISKIMAEIARICTNGAEVTMITPHFTSLASWRDPTHVHHLSYFSFDHFAKADVAHYTGGGFEIAERKLSFGGGLMGLMGRFLCWMSPKAYERKWCFIFRASTLRFTLRVAKV